MSQKRKVTLAALIGTAVMASVFAVAANITVNSTQLGAGGTPVASCDDEVDASYTTAYDPGLPGYEVTHVEIGGVAPACEGQEYKVTFTDDGDAVEGTEQTGTWGAASTFNHPVTGSTVSAKDVTGVYVTFHGDGFVAAP